MSLKKASTRTALAVWLFLMALFLLGFVTKGGIGWIVCMLIWTISIPGTTILTRYHNKKMGRSPTRISRVDMTFVFSVAPLALLVAISEILHNSHIGTRLRGWLKEKIEF